MQAVCVSVGDRCAVQKDGRLLAREGTWDHVACGYARGLCAPYCHLRMRACAMHACQQDVCCLMMCGTHACAAARCRDANIVDVSSYDELKAAVAAGKWARGGWAGSDKQEGQIKEETQVGGAGWAGAAELAAAGCTA
jgi:hypothetical protein